MVQLEVEEQDSLGGSLARCCLRRKGEEENLEVEEG